MKPTLKLNKERFFASLSYEPHEGQWAVHRSNAPRRVLACGVRWGKSTCAMMEGMTAAMEPRAYSKGWIVAPNYELAHRIYHQMVELFQEELPHRVVECVPREHRLIITNLAGGKSEIRARTADNPVSLLGEGLDWLIVDEFARLKPEIWEGYLSQRLADRRGWALLISTPDGKGYFHEIHQRGAGDDPEWKSWNFPTWTNPHIDKDFLESEKERLPEKVYLQEYGARFLGDGPIPCETCGFPEVQGLGAVRLGEHEELRRCPECQLAVDADGKPLSVFWGQPCLKVRRVVLGPYWTEDRLRRAGSEGPAS